MIRHRKRTLFSESKGFSHEKRIVAVIRDPHFRAIEVDHIAGSVVVKVETMTERIGSPHWLTQSVHPRCLDTQTARQHHLVMLRGSFAEYVN